MKRFLLVLVAILLCLTVAPKSQANQTEKPTSSADVWCLGTFTMHPYEGCDLLVSAAEDTSLRKDANDYNGGFLVGTFAGENSCSNGIFGVITPKTVITIANRSVIRSELNLLNGHLVWAVAHISTTGEGEGTEITIKAITIYVLR